MKKRAKAVKDYWGRNSFKINSIQSIITISFTAVTIIAMLLVGIGLYSTFSFNAESNAASSAQQIMDQANINFEHYLNQMLDISDLMRRNIKEVNPESMQNLDDMISLTFEMREDIVTVAVFSKTGNAMLTNPQQDIDRNYRISKQEWFKQTLEKPNEYLFQPPHVQRLFVGSRPWVISLCRGLDVVNSGRDETWVAMVDMNFSVIEELCSKVSLGKRGYIYVIDEYGNIIYHPQQQLLYSGLKEEPIEKIMGHEQGSFIDDFKGEQRITTVKDIKYTGWRMIGVSYVDELSENRQSFTNFIVYILLFGIAFVILASMVISSKISQPIKRLEHQMNSVESGNFDIELLEVKGEDEVKRLTRAFNLMIVRIKQLMNQIITEQEEKRRSQFKALQAQINPHFLYNTLDSIIWMNENQNHEGVTKMVDALAKFFRISISKGNEIIDVKDEVEHARSYLVIQKIRYKNKFEYSINVQEEAYEHKTLKLILQPIIENAIYHGINKIHEKGKIEINVEVKDDKLLFKVEDNGFGIEKEQLKKILDSEPANKRTSGVGLKNVHERIQLTYGADYGVKIKSRIEVGTIVTIIIPVTQKGNGEDYEDVD